jgi:hypothetical protein
MSSAHQNTNRKITKSPRVLVRTDNPDNDTLLNEYRYKRRLAELYQCRFPLTIFSTRHPWRK